MGEGPGLPSGTVTFVFTDIERSTQTVAALGDERYARLQAVHRRLLREAFDSSGGHEVATEGDAFFFAFERPADAVHGAVEAQRRMGSHDWPEGGPRLRVRIGVHTGDALVSEDNYVGHDVHKAKRIADAGHGGQILMSRTTRDLVAGHLPHGARVTDLGPHRLKDIADPEHLFQLAADDLQAEFPLLRTLGRAQDNLPVQLTTFVGRDHELAEVAKMLGLHRLVTLTGVGGSGKTRLALQSATSEFERSPDGVFFCDLSTVSDEDGVAPAVLRSIDIDALVQVGQAGAREALHLHLGRRSALLVIDNCEHVVDAVADLAASLLTSCPALRILATSRESLGVEGESAWSVPSLGLDGDAVRLFAERAAASRRDFAITDENEKAIGAICARLDGIPLAIELAAAQLSHLSPRQIAERLDARFLQLTGGRRRVQRQQTLQAAMDWSWELLEDRDRTMLSRMAVFQGGCTLEAAESVCGADIDVVGGLRSLVAKSLVVVTGTDDSVRYRLLETVRMYGEDKLSTSADVESLRTRHRDYYLGVMESLFDREGIFFGLMHSILELEQDNVRAALRWSEAQGRHDLVARMLCATYVLWNWYHVEAIERHRALLEHELDDVLRGRVLACLATHEGSTGNAERVEKDSEDAIRLLGDEPSVWLHFALHANAQFKGIRAIATQDPQLAEDALVRAERATSVGRSFGPGWAARGSSATGVILLMLLRPIEAAEAFAESIKSLREAGVGGTSLAIEGLWVAKHICPDEWTNELEAALQEGTRRYFAQSTNVPLVLSLDAALRGDVVEARKIFLDAVTFMRRYVPDLVLRGALVCAGIIAGLEGDFERAARLLAASMREGMMLSPVGFALYRHWLPRVRVELDPERARQLRDEGRAMSLDEALDYAIGDVS
jgi:predicted ATPase/class 3 adenylate cyclase